MRAFRLTALTALLVTLCGCAGIAKGVTEAILESGKDKDERLCHVEGPASPGLEARLREQEKERAEGGSTRTMKILMVHGIGRHLPGYSTRLTEHLMRELKLDVREERYKEIVLRQPEIWDGPLGSLRISRYTNKARTRELLFYELTWSEIVEPEKQTIEFDNSGEYAFRRTSLNQSMKEFFNSHIPDPLIYLGNARTPILVSVQQSTCWMTLGDWADYDDHTDGVCDLESRSRPQQVRTDDYAFVTHSLGSRIVIDNLQRVVEWIATQDSPAMVELKNTFREKELPIFMLANQLPLLELGRDPAAVRGRVQDYCRPDGDSYDQRLVGRTSIHAFSDPNDILSYGLPPKFADAYLDSRLCPKITNISINVAKPISLFGLGEVANPAEAHVGYDNDERVIALIAHGIGHEKQAPVSEERCTWLETTEK
jgi:hypothetical protein